MVVEVITELQHQFRGTNINMTIQQIDTEGDLGRVDVFHQFERNSDLRLLDRILENIQLRRLWIHRHDQIVQDRLSIGLFLYFLQDNGHDIVDVFLPFLFVESHGTLEIDIRHDVSADQNEWIAADYVQGI